MALIELQNLSKHFDGVAAVDDVSLEIERGELLVLLGGSGSGKTTTLKLINRLIEPTSGRVRIDGVDTSELRGHELRRGIGYCFQQVGLFPHLTVAENVSITPELLGWSELDRAARASELLTMVGLDPTTYEDRRPDELSGGQQQRVGIARALAARPEIILFDEPFGALDPLTRDQLQQSLQSIRRELGLTGVFVTHDMVEALLVGDRIAVLEDGHLAQVGSPGELMRTPANEYVARLMETPRRQANAIEHLMGDEAPS